MIHSARLFARTSAVDRPHRGHTPKPSTLLRPRCLMDSLLLRHKKWVDSVWEAQSSSSLKLRRISNSPSRRVSASRWGTGSGTFLGRSSRRRPNDKMTFHTSPRSPVSSHHWLPFLTNERFGAMRSSHFNVLCVIHVLHARTLLYYKLGMNHHGFIAAICIYPHPYSPFIWYDIYGLSL